MDIIPEQIIWYPGPDYASRESADYTQPIKDLPIETIISLVTKRATEDGEYSIENDLVGKNRESEPKMRRMMAFVSDPKFIEQCVDYIYKEETEAERTVDYVCRDLANASKWAMSVKK